MAAQDIFRIMPGSEVRIPLIKDTGKVALKVINPDGTILFIVDTKKHGRIDAKPEEVEFIETDLKSL